MMQLIMGSLLLAIWVFPLVTILIVVRKLAVNSYRDNNYTAPTWFSSLGKKIANSKSMKFTIIFATALVATTLILLTYSLYEWFRPSYSSSNLLQSSLIPAPPVLLFLLIGLFYVTMTHHGLAWWDANVIIFRYTGFHGRRSYLKDEIKSLIEENQDGVDDPYRAYLTLERLYNHEFDVGEVTREIIEQIAPEYHKELENKLLQSAKTIRFSYLLLLIAVTVGFLSVFLFVFGSLVHLPLYNNLLVVDTLLSIALSFHLMWMIYSTLELPIMRAERYLTKRDATEAVDDIHNST